MRNLITIAALLAAAPAMADHHGEGAPDPDIGAVANIDEAKTLAAAQLVTEGKTYRLGIVTGRDTPAYAGRSYDIEVIDLGTQGENRLSGFDDRIDAYMGIGSQIDGFGHVGIDGVHYNGVRAEDFAHEDGLVRYGTENIPAIATRGVLIDMAAHFGVETLAPGASFDAADIQAAAAEQGVTVERGDVVLFHMGWLSRADEPEVFVMQQPGVDVDGARWLADQGVVAVGSDTPGLETSASPEGVFIPVHQLLIAERGVHILETLDTRELAADGVSEFLFVLGVPRFEGTVQGVINPVAIR